MQPHEDTFFQITFHPSVVDNDIRFKKVKCMIEGVTEPLYITLLGKCVPQPKEQIQELKFETLVRSSQSLKANIKNTTAKPWKIRVALTTNIDQFKGYFQGKEYLEVPANGNADYTITYQPLTMTSNDQVP